MKHTIILSTILSLILSVFPEVSAKTEYDFDTKVSRSSNSDSFRTKANRHGKISFTEFTIEIDKKSPTPFPGKLQAHFFVFGANDVSDRERVHFHKSFPDIRINKKSFSRTLTTQFRDVTGENLGDREYKGSLLVLTDSDGNILKVESTKNSYLNRIPKLLKKYGSGKRKPGRKKKKK